MPAILKKKIWIHQLQTQSWESKYFKSSFTQLSWRDYSPDISHFKIEAKIGFMKKKKKKCRTVGFMCTGLRSRGRREWQTANSLILSLNKCFSVCWKSMCVHKGNNLQKTSEFFGRKGCVLGSWEEKSLYFIRMYSSLKSDILYSTKLWGSEFNHGRVWCRYAKCGISHKASGEYWRQGHEGFVIVINCSLIR